MQIHTYADLQAVPPARMWQLLRTLRHQPPGYAARGQRRDTFNAALEQAEQLFAAAESVGTSTRPILIFYGVSQLGRAIAAAATCLLNSSYQLSSHGLHDGDLGAIVPGKLHSLTIGSNTKGAFPVVAQALGASAMADDMTIGQLWGLIPDASRFPLPGAGGLQAFTLEPESPHIVRVHEWARINAYPLPLDLLGVKAERSELSSVLERSYAEPELIARQRELLGAWLLQYPTMDGWDVIDYVEPNQPLRYRFTDNVQSLLVPLRLPKDPSESELQAIEKRACRYHQIASVYPRLDAEPRPAHPFMLWWAVLYCLSRLARYEPRAWSEITNVGRSSDAAPIEYLLAEALLALPELAYEAIVRVSQEETAAKP